MSDAQLSYQEFIPTDKWSLQDWYLMKMVVLERTHNRLMKGFYSGGIDKRALVDFYSEIRGYYLSAKENFKKHLSEDELKEFVNKIFDKPENMSVERAEELMVVLSVFHWKSGLSKLSESRPMGDFAYARQKLGMMDDPK